MPALRREVQASTEDHAEDPTANRKDSQGEDECDYSIGGRHLEQPTYHHQTHDQRDDQGDRKRNRRDQRDVSSEVRPGEDQSNECGSERRRDQGEE